VLDPLHGLATSEQHHIEYHAGVALLLELVKRDPTDLHGLTD